ncbi:ATPase inhibitor, mitochondrial [Cricetulus griseus]|uniref:ATPase inhibitor, mitochondrial n=1 Tax=Cricetulus griseus TaxID=10029 RepID=G3H1Z3_CRIGR|nr:ATPase inhibitor, mitochondrial [Cricetulus griseus]XP_027255323.1 ATPase inhibitor, mitochondrial [Cricetulus griseus]EGW01163.1 ATPase inhibitor, mitochondrial [Cricetulus griseus]ERE85937.1 ATPase inhibitor [Cricetulus griseus]
MAGSALATRARLGAWGVRVLQTRGFGSDSSGSTESGAGAIREAGGAFGKREKSEEDRYFREKTKEQLAALKKHHEDEIQYHEQEIERLQKQIERHKKKMKNLKNND